MVIGIIDLGTNSIRFDVHQVSNPRKSKLLYRDKQMVRLGQGVFRSHKLSRGGISRTLEALSTFCHVMEDFEVDRTVAYATAALREARDGPKFIRTIKKETGISFKIISGNEEARLIALGIMTNEDIGNSPVSMIDIGGGSTEISVGKKNKILRTVTLPLGAARLQQRFIHNDPPKKADFAKLHLYVVGVLYETVAQKEWPLTETMIGSSGTVRTLARIMKRLYGKTHIDGLYLKELVQEMREMPAAKRLKIPGMDSKRVDMILSGAIILERAMDMLHATRVFPTEYTLRDGILINEMQKMRKRQKHTTPLF